jgi:hypothetical protein
LNTCVSLFVTFTTIEGEIQNTDGDFESKFDAFELFSINTLAMGVFKKELNDIRPSYDEPSDVEEKIFNTFDLNPESDEDVNRFFEIKQAINSRILVLEGGSYIRGENISVNNFID